MQKILYTLKCFIALFSANRITQASAALSYYLTMTFFPMLIVSLALLGNSPESIADIMDFAGRLVSAEMLELVREYLIYISQAERKLMLPLGLALLISYASAALRSMHAVIGSLQGGPEYRGISSYFISFLYSLMLLALLYFALVVMLFGRGAVEWLNLNVPGMDILFNWLYLRYLILAGLMLLLLLLLYHVPKRASDDYSVLPGAAFSSLVTLGISPLFSAVISRSAKYSVVYGSLASVILLMLWLYMCCIIIYSGAILNLALYKSKHPQAQ